MAQGTSNPTTDLKKVAGTAVDVNTGNASAGTQRVVLASDQPAVSVSVDSAIATVTALTGGGIAHDAADSGNPHKIGARARTSLISIGPVAENDRTDIFADLDGAVITRANSPHGDRVYANVSNTDGASTSLFAAITSTRICITDITLTNTSATTVYVEIKDGATAKWTFPVPAGGGVTHNFGTPLMGTTNTAWNFDSSAAVTTLIISAAGYKTKAF